jgi:SNF2 family DNA or RNA helicase
VRIPKWIASAPTDFRGLKNCVPDGWIISQRVVEPHLRLRRSEFGFVAELFGRRIDKGNEKLIPALSLSHNWILDGTTIRPLPQDVPEILTTLLPENERTRLHFVKILELLRNSESPISIDADESVYIPGKAEAEKFDGSETIPGLDGTLYPYQARGVEWMLDTIKHTGGLVLADEMGLGKTIQIISLLLSERPTKDSPALIVCPTTLIANWRNEILRFGPELSMLIHRGANRTGVSSGLHRSQIVITTYDTLVNDQTIFRDVRWSWLISDEAQAVKNPASKRRIAMASIPRERTIPMTGTPVETSLLDLWSLADLAIPGLLGDQDKFEHSFPDDEDSARNLSKITDPIILRRRVADVAGDLPDRIDIDIPLELGADLASAYTRVLHETIEKYPTAGALVATGQLQIFCAHPWLISSGAAGADDFDEELPLDRSREASLLTPKMIQTVALLEEAFAAGRKVLVFAVFNRCGDLIREACSNLPEAYWSAINGSTAQEDRQKIVDEFTAHEGPGCLILNPKAAGTGLNITAANVVVHYTQVWNPALELQASARAHRRGQTEPVYIYRLYYEDTVERVMIDRSKWRREMGNEAVPVSTRDADDLRRALELEPEVEQ